MGFFPLIAVILFVVLPALVVLWRAVRMTRTYGAFERRVRRELWGYMFVFPAYLFFVFIILIPTFGTFWLSFKVPLGQFAIEFRHGLGNYVTVMRDPNVHEAFLNNTFYLFATLIVEVLVGLIMAIILADDRRGFHFFRLLFFTPMMLSMVIVSLLWKFILRSEGGLLSHTLNAVGLSSLADTPWMAHPTFTLPTICLISGWIYAGFYLILFHAAIRRIPPSLLESARLDGCNEFQLNRHVTLPLMKDVSIVCVLICATGAFKAFDLFYVMSPSGANHTEMVATYLVKQILDYDDPYYGSTIAVLMTVVVFALSLIITAFQKRTDRLEF